jgi:hypothetical protein
MTINSLSRIVFPHRVHFHSLKGDFSVFVRFGIIREYITYLAEETAHRYLPTIGVFHFNHLQWKQRGPTNISIL